MRGMGSVLDTFEAQAAINPSILFNRWRSPGDLVEAVHETQREENEELSEKDDIMLRVWRGLAKFHGEAD